MMMFDRHLDMPLNLFSVVSKISNPVDKYMFKDNSNTRYTTVEKTIIL